jgi:hypothetical protein
MADSQVPWGVEALNGTVSDPAWRSKPSWYLVTTEDRMIPPALQRKMAERAGARTTEVAGSHAIYVSQPATVATLIKRRRPPPRLRRPSTSTNASLAGRASASCRPTSPTSRHPAEAHPEATGSQSLDSVRTNAVQQLRHPTPVSARVRSKRRRAFLTRLPLLRASPASRSSRPLRPSPDSANALRGYQSHHRAECSVSVKPGSRGGRAGR